MRAIISVLLVFAVISTSYGQAKKRGKVKRKYRNVEQTNQSLPPVYLRGEIYDFNDNPVSGASVSVDGTTKSVNSNSDGEFLIENLQTGKARLRISHLGYETKTIDYEIRQGENFYKMTLDQANIHLDPVTVNAQKREQQIIDIPTAITAIDASTIEKSNITDLSLLSEFVPGLYIREQGANRPSFVIRGLTSDEVSPSAQPRISVYYNNVPINRASSASVELFDMAQVEVLKGPQNTLFGRGAQAGAVHFKSIKPGNTFDGYLSAGAGNFMQKEARGAINIPVIEDMLFVRAAGIYSIRDGYVENTFGGTLNGKNTQAGRFSVRFLPTWNHRFDIELNYQKDDTPGIAFMSKTFPNTNGEIDIFGGVASLEQGENLGTGKDFFDAALNYNYYIDEHNYLSVIGSYRKSNATARWDGDGTAAPAIDMAEKSSADQLYGEIRYNFTKNSRLNGSAGASYWSEKADQTYSFSPNEQSLVHLFSPDNSNFVDTNGQPILIPAIPNYISELDSTIYIPLPTDHQEENYSTAQNRAAEAYIDGTYQLTRKIFISAGVRAVYDMYSLNGSGAFTGASHSTLGGSTENYPNLFFKPGEYDEIMKSTLSFTYRAGLEYHLNDNTNIFANYTRGRRPKVLQYTSSGETEILDAEILNNYDAGFKTNILSRVYVDVVGFYQKYKNFQSTAWEETNYIVKDGGQATSYGAEANLKVALLNQFDLFANYAWLNATFDSTNTDGSRQEYNGNSFRLSPEHSFTVGFNARANIAPNIIVFVSPSYSYKTHFYFEDANTPGLDQDPYGLLNINGGMELTEPNLILSVYGTNILDKDYLTSAGNTGSLFGVPTFVPGAPRMYGAKLTWKFGVKEKPYYRRGRLNR